MDWNFFSRRRKKSLESFLEGVTTFEAALNKFSTEGIENPPREEIKSLLASKEQKKVVVPEISSVFSPPLEIPVAESVPAYTSTHLSETSSSSFYSKKKVTKKTDEPQTTPE